MLPAHKPHTATPFAVGINRVVVARLRRMLLESRCEEEAAMAWVQLADAQPTDARHFLIKALGHMRRVADMRKHVAEAAIDQLEGA